jgi:Arrestin (or S-antigen), N-terminal domain
MDLVGATDLLDVGILQLWMTTRSDHYMPNDVVSGCVKLVCSKSLSIRGLWVKFTGVNILKNLNERRIKTHEGVDLLVGDADHYLGGLHDVLVGFGEQDEIELVSNASTPLLPLACGDHTWNFSFQIPSEAPFSYCDIYTEIIYSATIYLDIPKVLRIASQVMQNLDF